jgi:hypothetical protein
MLDGRVKTLHPKVHGGILALRDNPSHMRELEANQIQPIDLVVVNLYPFLATVEAGASLEQALEQIDIGGVTLLRASAKNFPNVVSVCDPRDYPHVLNEMKRAEGVAQDTRRRDGQGRGQHRGHRLQHPGRPGVAVRELIQHPNHKAAQRRDADLPRPTSEQPRRGSGRERPAEQGDGAPIARWGPEDGLHPLGAHLRRERSVNDLLGERIQQRQPLEAGPGQ